VPAPPGPFQNRVGYTTFLHFCPFGGEVFYYIQNMFMSIYEWIPIFISPPEASYINRYSTYPRKHRKCPHLIISWWTTSGRIPSRNQQRKGCSGPCPEQKGKGWDVRDWTRGCMTRVNPMSGNRTDNRKIGTKALSQSLDRGDNDVRRSAE
jgi:hypothetical protein